MNAINYGESFSISTFARVEKDRPGQLVNCVICKDMQNMAIQVVEFSNGGYKIRKIFA